MDLVTQRLVFTRCLGQLLHFAAAVNLHVVVDQVKRTQAEAEANAAAGTGIFHSLHRLGLAADLILYRRNGEHWEWLKQGTEPEYAMLGAAWKKTHPSCRWGGDFSKPDYGHFSSERDGIR